MNTNDSAKRVAYALDDGPLTAKQIAAIRKLAAKHLPNGKVLRTQELFKPLNGLLSPNPQKS
jgi:hypothetical protein